MTEGSKSNILGLDGSTRVNTSTATINNPSNFNLQTIVNAPVLKERSSNEDGAGYYVDRKSTTLSPTDKPLIVQQQGRGFFFRGSQYEPLKQSAVAIGVGVNDKAVIFSPYNFIDEPDLNQSTTFSSKRNEDAIKSLDKQNEVDSKQSYRFSRSPRYRPRSVNSVNLDPSNQFGFNQDVIFDDPLETKSPTILQDPEKNSDYQFSNIVKTFRTRKELKNHFHSYLIFTSDQGRILLPFFENPIIEERRGAAFSIVPVMGSSDPIITYTHTDLASIRVTFRLNAYHISEMIRKLELQNKNEFMVKSQQTSVDEAINDFFKKGQPQDLKDGLGLDPDQLLTNPRAKFRRENPISRDLDIKYESDQGSSPAIAGIYNGEAAFPSVNSYYLAQELIVFWINTIKSFNITGIPSNLPSAALQEVASWKQSEILNRRRYIFLKHGPAFHKIPSILEGYEIKELNPTTYDVPTSMANCFEISLNLKAAPEQWQNSSSLVVSPENENTPSVTPSSPSQRTPVGPIVTPPGN